jgi:membrane protease YdiL (CAAX protease family)
MESSTASVETSPARERAALGLWLGVAAIQIASSFALGGSGGARDDEPLYDYSLAVGSLVLYGILIALTFWIASLYPNRLAALGLRRFPARTVWIVVAVVIASIAVSAALEPILHAGREQGLEPEQWRSDRAGAFVVNALVVTTLVPFAEELFFRGLGVRVLTIFGSLVAVVGTAVVFALAHGIPVAIPALGFFALLLGWLRLSTDSVWPCVLAHAAYNGVGVLAFFVSSQS